MFRALRLLDVFDLKNLKSNNFKNKLKESYYLKV